MCKAQGLDRVGFSRGRISSLREEKLDMCMEEGPQGSLRAKDTFLFQVVLMA